MNAAGTRPGLAPFTDEWMAEVATSVAEPLCPVVRAICEAYQIGDSDAPNTLAKIIERELERQIQPATPWHKLYDGTTVGPGLVTFDGVWGFMDHADTRSWVCSQISEVAKR